MTEFFPGQVRSVMTNVQISITFYEGNIAPSSGNIAPSSVSMTIKCENDLNPVLNYVLPDIKSTCKQIFDALVRVSPHQVPIDQSDPGVTHGSTNRSPVENDHD